MSADKVVRIFASLSLIFGFSAVILYVYWSKHFLGGFGSRDTFLFNWHPLLALIGMFLCFSPAVNMFRVNSRASSKANMKRAHILLNSMALILMIASAIIVYAFHEQKGFPNWKSTHSWIALFFLSLYTAQFLYGFSVFYFPGARTSLRVRSLPYHKSLGSALLGLGVAVILTGIMEKQTFVGSKPTDPVRIFVNFISLSAAASFLFAAAALFAPKPQQSQGSLQTHSETRPLLA